VKIGALLLVSAVVGVACGLASLSPLLAGQWANLIVWALAGLLLGLFARSGRDALWGGLVYGLLLSVTFLLAGFQGAPDKLPAFLALTLALSVVGMLCGAACVWAGSRARRLIRR
jgi:hypothetical protein